MSGRGPTGMLVNKVKGTIRRYNLIGRNDRVIVAVSGGPDSVALLYSLNALSRELRINLHIAHLDHGLRKGSYKDRKFVEGIAKKLKLPVTSARVNIRGLAKRGSLEEIARNARLGFLFRAAEDIKADKIALGHNLDDQAETVIMRLLRGAGLYGLSGIMPKRKIAGFTVIRPLIEIKRSEIEAYLKKKKIKACQDASNREDIYFRNRVRNRLLPQLEKGYNKNIKEVLSNAANSIGLDYDYLNRQAALAMRRLGNKLYLKKLIKLHPAILRLVLRLSIARLKGNMRRLSFKHIAEIEDLIYNRRSNSIVDLPSGVSVIKRKGCVSFYRRTAINT